MPAPIAASLPTSREEASLARLSETDSAPNHPSQRANLAGFENQLAVVRLGMASSLFYALRAKHPATAAHSLRVALSVSAWCERMGLPAEQRDRLEVAGLLHDLGKIGIPDRILRKPSKLDDNERLTVDLTPQITVEILRGCTDDADLLGIVQHRYQWFSSRRDFDGPSQAQLPVGARMLAIAGAFDAMTTDAVYRPAMSRGKSA